MPTYNHERFVAQAIESVLAQKTAFAYRLIVGDDCSTDGTQAIVKSYAERHPDVIEFFSSPKNLGALHRDRVGVKALKKCTAWYVAILEGDDYWTDPYKLQKQVDFLEGHPECAASFHDVLIFHEDGSAPARRLFPANQKELSTLEDILTSGVFPMPCTLLHRNELLREFPDCFYQVRNADWMISVLLARRGDLGFINEVMAAYRVHGGGIWSSLNRIQGIRENIKTYETIDAYLTRKYHRAISEKVSALRRSLHEQYRQHARTRLDQYHALARRGKPMKGLRLLLEATRSSPSEVLRPHRFLAVLKNGILGILHNKRT